MTYETETALAAVVIRYLKRQGFTVSTEVVVPGYDGATADIVAVRTNGETWIVETKLTLNLTLLAQCDRWVRYAHKVWAVVPGPFGLDGKAQLIEWIVRGRGFGVMCVGESGNVYPTVPAKFYASPISIGLHDILKPEHETYAEAGNADGRKFTPFAQTRDRLVAAVIEEPGLKLQEYIGKIQHHWRSDDFALAKLKPMLKRNNKQGIRGIRLDWNGRHYRLYPNDGAGE